MGSRRSVPVTFLGVMAVLVFALGWLGWLLLDQDLSLKEQRIRERVDAAAFELEEAVVNGINTQQEYLNRFAAALTAPRSVDIRSNPDLHQSEVTLVHFSADGITVTPKTGLRYLPESGASESLPAEFELADRFEFQQKDYPAAMNLLKPLTESPEAHVQVAALMRVGRIERRIGDIDKALNTYEVLVRYQGQRVGSVPANWLGLYARCAIFEAQHNINELGSELSRLVAVLIAGGYEVSAASYQYYVDAAVKWATVVGQVDAVQVLVQPHTESEMTSRFFKMWSDGRQGISEVSGIRIGGGRQNYVFGIWTTFGSDLLANMLTLDEFQSKSLTSFTDKMANQGIGWRISDATGQVLLSSIPLPPSAPSSLRSVAIGGVAFNVTAFATADLIPDANDTNRRHLLFTGLLLILAIILASTYFISRSLRREAEISRLQSDFVAAVSHEFRTPLTSIRQLAELLASGRVENEEKAAVYYRILEKESARLQRLVEGLLDFGRMEAGAHPYQPEALNCGTFLDEIVTAFREEYDLTKEILSLEIKGSPHVWMDRETLNRAIWNLLDNAVKYSPVVLKIGVKAQVKNNKVNISVTDQGVGIPTSEQSEVFSKFVRGSTAHLTNAKGTGMGLAMVRKIIEDQGGSVSACNNPGGGSVFTIVLASRE
jgi:signal transduction histidine kinase